MAMRIDKSMSEVSDWNKQRSRCLDIKVDAKHIDAEECSYQPNADAMNNGTKNEYQNAYQNHEERIWADADFPNSFPISGSLGDISSSNALPSSTISPMANLGRG